MISSDICLISEKKYYLEIVVMSKR